MSITPEQRQQWRKDAEWKTESFPFTAPAEYSDRILALLDALDAAEANALRDAADEIDGGPTFPLPPSVLSALLRERADQIEGQR